MGNNHQVKVTNFGDVPVIAGFAKESGGNLADILGKLDITQTALANLLRGASTKDLTTLQAVFAAGTVIGDVNVKRSQTIVSTGGSCAGSGNNTLLAAVASLKIKVLAFSLSTTSTTAVTCIFQSGASGTELWRVLLQAPTACSTGANLATNLPAQLFETAVNTLLNLNLSSAQTIHWSITYILEA